GRKQDFSRVSRIEVRTGGGDDMVMADVPGSLPLMLAVDLGRGDDHAELAYTGGPGWEPGSHGVTVLGGAGRDDIRVTTEFVMDGSSLSRPRMKFPPFTVTIDGGSGGHSINSA